MLFDTCFQVVNEGDTESQEELEESPTPVVDENNIVSAKKQGPNLHNWSGDWSFWVIFFLSYIFIFILNAKFLKSTAIHIIFIIFSY